MRRYLIIIYTTLLTLSAPAQVADSVSSAIRQRLDSLVASYPVLRERTQIGLCVYDLTADTALYDLGARQQLRPASTQKVFTAVAALHYLGGDYRLRTTLTSLGRDSLSFIIRGGMDPQFGEEGLRDFVRAIRDAAGDTVSGDIYLDLSMKDTLRMGPGWCWDDDTKPLTPLLLSGRDTFGASLLAALQRDSVVVLGRLLTITDPRESARLVSGSAGEVRPVAEYSTTIDQVLYRMMKRSDNNYAESLFYQLGRTAGSAASRVKDFLNAIGVDTRVVRVADGSGLSLYNYTTPEALVHTLRYAWRHSKIYSHLQPALPVAGVDGTLSRRMKDSSAYSRVMAKTGTVRSVSTLAGYAMAPNGHMLAFAVMNQGIMHQSSGHDFQDAVCQALCAPLPPAPLPESEEGQSAEPQN